MTSRGPRQPLDAATVAQLVNVTMRLAMEQSVLRDRLRTHELLLAKHGLLNADEVDALVLPESEQKQRDAQTRTLIEALTEDLLRRGG